MYYQGKGVPQDYAEAVKWYRKAVAQGDDYAQNNLGWAYEHGHGVSRDYAAAVKLYRLAANRGNAEAQSSLGAMYENGRGVPIDHVQAHMWFSLAVAGFPASATDRREQSAQDRDRVSKRMTPAQIAQAQRLASDWKPSE
jgi:TPR repeat protein